MAGGRIAGITIEIGGDTQKLNKALSGVNKDLNSTSKELRDVNRLLKLDPKNTTLLAQKQKLLADQIGKTKDKLATLKDAEEQARQALEKGEIGQKEFDGLQREIVDTENKLKSLENEAEKMNKSFSKVSEAGESLQKTGQAIEGVGKKLLPVTAGVTAIGTASVAAFKEMDAGYDTVIKKTGATGDALSGLKENVNNVFSGLPVSAEEAGVAIGEVNTRFSLTGKILEDTSKQFLMFAKINDTDLNNSIDNVDAVMNKFGIDSSEVGNVLGLLTKASQDTGINMDVLLGALTQNSAVFKEMNLTLPESVNLLAQFEANGVEASVAIAGLKKAQQEATADGKTLGEALGSTIENIKNASTETQALQIATELFGKKGAAEMTQAIREGRLSIDDLTASLGDYGNVVNDTFSETQDPLDQATLAFNNLKLAGSELGTTLLSELAPYIETIVNKLGDLVNWFSNLDDGTKKMIITVAGIVAAVGPLLIVIGKTLIFVGQLMTFLPTLSKGFSVVTGAVGGLSSGFLIAAGVIAAIIAVGVLLYKNWDTIKAKAKELFNKIKETFDGIKNKISDAWDGAKRKTIDVIREMLMKIKEFLRDTKEKFSKIKEDMSKPFEQAKDKIKEAIDKIKDKIDGFKSKLKDLATFKWLKIPHISISGGKVPFGIGGKGEKPSFSIEWHAKAMEQPFMLDKATIFGMAGGNLLGGGEKGREMIYGHDSLMTDISNASGGKFMPQIFTAISNLLSITSRYLPSISDGVNGSSGMDKRDIIRFIRGVT